MRSIHIRHKVIPGLIALLAAGELLTADAGSKTYRIRGRRFTQEEIAGQHEKIRWKYVMHGGQVVAAESVGAFPINLRIERVVEPMIVVGRAAGKVETVGRPDSAPRAGARTGKEFTIAETDSEILADISKGAPFAVRLEKPAASMPLSGEWSLMVVDSKTFLDRVKQGRIKGHDLGKLRVFYDVTIDLDGFIALLQRGQVFTELEP